LQSADNLERKNPFSGSLLALVLSQCNRKTAPFKRVKRIRNSFPRRVGAEAKRLKGIALRIWVEAIQICHGDDHAEQFLTKKGCPFSYRIRNDYIVLLNTPRTIPKWQVEEALGIQADTVTAYGKYQGPSYLFALLHDPRIIST